MPWRWGGLNVFNRHQSLEQFEPKTNGLLQIVVNGMQLVSTGTELGYNGHSTVYVFEANLYTSIQGF